MASAAVWQFDSSDGELLVTTGVSGPAATMGHRLTLTMPWQATVRWADDEPVEVAVVVDVDSLEVLRGEGGVKGLSGPEKALARSNALKVFDAGRYPRIRFQTDDVTRSDGGYRLDGTLEIHGTVRAHAVEVHVDERGETWKITGETVVRHSDFGLKPYSMMMGAMKVTDEVTVSFTAERVAG